MATGHRTVATAGKCCGIADGFRLGYDDEDREKPENAPTLTVTLPERHRIWDA
jgi:hypothetical protein